MLTQQQEEHRECLKPIFENLEAMTISHVKDPIVKDGLLDLIRTYNTQVEHVIAFLQRDMDNREITADEIRESELYQRLDDTNQTLQERVASLEPYEHEAKKLQERIAEYERRIQELSNREIDSESRQKYETELQQRDGTITDLKK